jgi:uncharacterized membrane protein
MDLIYTIGIIIFALAGAFISGYIARVKNKKEHLSCPFGENCDVVINSRFSRFFGIRNEIIGLVYYTAIVLFYISILFFSIPKNIIFYVLLITVLAFVFNLHLIFTQLIVIKRWCTICLGSSASSFLITVMAFLGFQASFGNYLFEMHDILIWVFIFMVIVGVIVTTLHARTFIFFLRDFEISQKEAKRLAMFSHTGWVAITFSFLSGLGLVLTDIYNNITGGSRFMVMLLIIGLLIVYEVVVNMFIGPKLIDVHFGDHPELEDHHHMMLRKTSFAFVAIGVVSWYSLLLLSTISFYKYSTIFLLLAYLILIIIAVVVSLYAEHIYYKRSKLVYDTIENVIVDEE